MWFIYESHNHICFKPRRTVAPCFISHHFCFEYKMRCKSPFVSAFQQAVWSAHGQVLPYGSRSKARLLTATWELPSFTLSSIPARGLPGGLFPGILPSITNGTWSPCRRVWPSQTLWQIWVPLLTDTPQYFFVTDCVRPSYVKKPFSKVTSHSSPAFTRPLSLRSNI